jgi:hypothetical protein
MASEPLRTADSRDSPRTWRPLVATRRRIPSPTAVLRVEDYAFDRCWHEYQAHAVYGLILTIPTSLGVQRTDRGDAMFATMLRRVAAQVAANESFAALAAL